VSRKFLVPVVLPADPTAALEAATKQYVDGKVVGGGTSEVEIAAADPIGTNPTAELWYDTDEAAAPLTASNVSFTPTAPMTATDVQSAIAALAPTPWIAPTFQNGWVNYGLGWCPAGYRKIGDIVYLRGLIKSGALNTAIFTLPAGYIPGGGNLLMPTLGSDSWAQTQVLSSGAVVPQFGTVSGWWSLSGISFSVTG